MRQEIKRRVAAAIPHRDQLLPLAGSLAVPALLKLPLSVGVGLSSLWTIDRLRENPELVPAALVVYGAIALLSAGFDYTVLRKGGVSASPKVNLIYRALSFAFPNSLKTNQILAETLAIPINALGIGLEPSAYAATAATIFTGDIAFAVGQRFSASVLGTMTESTYAVALRVLNTRREKRLIKN